MKFNSLPYPMLPGVPISTQWGVQGYYYPIQIAQYGLSHYSKHLASGAQRQLDMVEDAEVLERVEENWVTGDGSSLRRTYDKEPHSQIIRFQTQGET